MLKCLKVDVPDGHATRYNIAPGTKIPALRNVARKSSPELASLHWGYVPPWAPAGAPRAPLINARIEGIVGKPAFRDAFHARRCVVPAGGFYEWHAEGRVRRPWLFQLRDEEPFLLAALWQTSTDTGGEPLERCAVLTTEPNELMRTVHTRMPVVLRVGDAMRWLDTSVAPDLLAADLARPFPSEEMIARPLDSRVNSVSFDDEACLAPPSGPPPDSQLSLGLHDAK